MANVLGCAGVRVERPDDLPVVLEDALTQEGPVVIDVLSDVDALAERLR